MTTGSLVGSILLPIAGLLLECFQELLETFKDAQGAPLGFVPVGASLVGKRLLRAC